MINQARLESSTCEIVLQGDCATIPMTGGYTAIVDLCDVDALAARSWHIHCGYARGFVNGKKVYMHRHILGLDKSEICDHINGNRLDNRRENLRLVDKQRNARNRVSGEGYNGVAKNGWGWAATVIRGKRTYYLGSFKDKRLAAYAVDAARLIHDGELLRPNVDADSIDADERKKIDAVVFVIMLDKKPSDVKPATIARMVNNAMSDGYWAKKLRMRTSVISSIRRNASAKTK